MAISYSLMRAMDRSMRPTIVQLRQFYSSRLGRRVKQRLRQVMLQHWGDHTAESIIGIGYTPPLLRVLDRTTQSNAVILALMPAEQGAIYWPVHTDNRSILADELMPPFAANSLQRVLIAHAFEFHERPQELLNVYWEMLSPGGRLMLIVPNRRGLWAHTGRTPFARGTSYRMGRVKDMLEEAQFTLRESMTALYTPPTAHPLLLRAWTVIEWVASMLLPGLGGVIIIEAEKQIYAGLGVPVQVARREKSWAGNAVPATERLRPSNRI
jgi:SAM-dependent methyltransferase